MTPKIPHSCTCPAQSSAFDYRVGPVNKMGYHFLVQWQRLVTPIILLYYNKQTKEMDSLPLALRKQAAVLCKGCHVAYNLKVAPKS